MATISISQKDFPLWLKGTGDLSVELGKINPLQPLPEAPDELLDVNFGGQGKEPFVLGTASTVTVAVKAGMHANLSPVWASTSASRTDVLKQFGLQDFFTNN